MFEAPALVPGAAIALPVVLCAAAAVDAYRRRIPNLISLGGIALGLGLWGWHAGVSGLFTSLAGMLLGAGLFLPFYVVRGMGAGDVKLMGAVGALLGPYHVLGAAIVVALLGGLIAGWAAFRQGRLRTALRDTLFVVFRLVPAKTLEGSSKSDAIPYGLAIAAGALLYLGFTVLA